ncbi:MAG: hypothetical protein ABI053_06825 [Lacisediminihabitans sp.]
MTSATIVATLYWMLLLALTAAALVFAILALKKPRQSWTAAGLLAIALVVATLRFQSAPLAAAVTLSLLCIALAVVGGGPAVNLTLALAGGSPAGEHGGILVWSDGADAAVKPKREVLRGGATIGILERFATVSAIIVGHPEAIAVIVALKGVGRFTELDASEARERFIIGSLMSLIWACASAALWAIALH